MSGRIKAKDLSYDSSLPPFLQRLHAQNAGRGDTDRHERPQARPKRQKEPNDDDGPTVVDGSGESVSREEFEKMTKAEALESPTGDVAGAGKGEVEDGDALKASGALPEESKRAEQKVTVTDGLATKKKRKAGKIVGEENDAGDEEKEEKGQDGDGVVQKVAKKIKKKAKPIKLAFDDEEG
jgi:hypothetical protein